MDYLKNISEDLLSYKIRLFTNKDLYNLTSQDIANLINKETGEELTESSYRKWWKNFQAGMDYSKQNHLNDDIILKEYEIKRKEFEKERYRFFDQRNAYNKEVRSEAREDHWKEIIEDAIANLPQIRYDNKREIIYSKTDIICQINDLHYGANVDNAWNKYNTDILNERMDSYYYQLENISKLHASKNCVVVANGDCISGNCHYEISVTNRENMIQQIMGVSELFANFLERISGIFNTVTFVVVAGNHSRIGKKDESIREERLDCLIPWYVEARCQNNLKIKIHKNMDVSLSVFELLGKKYCCVHGDYDSGTQAKRALNILAGNDVYAILCGHLHHNTTDYVDGIKVIMSGGMLGMDSFCLTKRIIGIPQQIVSVCDESGIICNYDINFK